MTTEPTTPGYQGYENYATWATVLWLSNDESTYHFVQELIAESKDDYDACQQLKEFLEEDNPLGERASLYSDLLTWAMGSIDYAEVVAHLKSSQE